MICRITGRATAPPTRRVFDHPSSSSASTRRRSASTRAASSLPTADKPELACLASRFPTGTPITITGLERVAAAEEVVAGLGFSQYRVRFHGDLARIEVPAAEIGRLADDELRERLLDGVRGAGFRFVTVDLSGYARGSSNPLAMGKA